MSQKKERVIEMRSLRTNLSKYSLTIVFSLYTLVTSFYQYLPEKVSYQVLKLPYVLLLCLGIVVMIRFLKKKYKPAGLAKYIFCLTVLLIFVYGFVTVWRFLHGGYEAARPSLYLAMAAIFGVVMFFAADCGIFPAKYNALNYVIISLTLNILQLVLGAFTYGGIRASSLLENIMVYDCITLALIPQLFRCVCREESGKTLRILAEVSLVSGSTIILISGSRSAALLLIPVFVLSVVVCCGKRKNSWKACGTIFLSVIVCVTLLVATDLYSARSSVERVMEWSEFKEDAEVPNNPGKTSGGMIPPVSQSEMAALIQISDGMREMLWKASAEEIRKSPIIGTGVVYFNCQYGELVLQQGSHNLLLETWLVFGGIGAILFLLMIAGPILFFLIHIRKCENAFWTLLSLGGILGLALVQPLMSMVTVTSLFWALAGCGHEEDVCEADHPSAQK